MTAQVGKQIGQGAYATVAFGLHKETSKKVAIKIYDPWAASEQPGGERERETSFLKKSAQLEKEPPRYWAIMRHESNWINREFFRAQKSRKDEQHAWCHIDLRPLFWKTLKRSITLSSPHTRIPVFDIGTSSESCCTSHVARLRTQNHQAPPGGGILGFTFGRALVRSSGGFVRSGRGEVQAIGPPAPKGSAGRNSVWMPSGGRW